MGHDLPYSEGASIPQIELSQAEKWAIDGKDLADHSISTRLPFVSAHVWARAMGSIGKTSCCVEGGPTSVLEVFTSAQMRGNSSAVGNVVQQVTQSGESVQVDAA